MNFNLSFVPDEKYYNEAYKAIVSSLKTKKYEPFFAITMIALGLWFSFQDQNKILGYFPILFSMIGVYEFFKLYFEKKKWLKQRLDSKIVGQKIELHFSDETIKHSGPFSKGELNWEGMNKILKTKKGILLKPENGISIYLPDKLFSSKEQIDFIMSKHK
ncbi:hypothetical protein EMA8858_04119 [Emticicia aquatica]|uniref:YcxB-like C-terminal domain-containing protein n=1 Tax=Emticicia aquatica TaxID=1681835 RepID=A0ABM9AVA9_9BACT|nr:YcxB family protein [Emticicia aquatica]CAH0997984.1 hypothetical protein EMA8858_04119 [Emticicia aquatica]